MDLKWLYEKACIMYFWNQRQHCYVEGHNGCYFYYYIKLLYRKVVNLLTGLLVPGNVYQVFGLDFLHRDDVLKQPWKLHKEKKKFYIFFVSLIVILDYSSNYWNDGSTACFGTTMACPPICPLLPFHKFQLCSKFFVYSMGPYSVLVRGSIQMPHHPHPLPKKACLSKWYGSLFQTLICL